jgi:phosphoglycolate phosphatase
MNRIVSPSHDAASPRTGSIKAILFDKDGTLVDFERTWGPALQMVLQDFADGRRADYERLAAISGFIESELRFLPDSIFVSHPVGVWGPLWAQALGRQADPGFMAEIDKRLCAATTFHLQAIGEPAKLMAELAAGGYRLGMLSNDSEVAVHAHVGKLGIDPFLQFAAGCDSGFGAKPDPGQVLAFAKAVGVDPSQIAVVGDTVLDFTAARAAGAVAVGVLSGPATAEQLSPHADVVLASAADVVAWLVAQDR